MNALEFIIVPIDQSATVTLVLLSVESTCLLGISLPPFEKPLYKPEANQILSQDSQ